MNSLAAIAVLLALPRVTAQCAPGTVAFSEHVITTLADDGQSVFAVDVDGDGDADILTASNYDDTVAWYENDGSQSFAENVLTNSANGANFVFAADVDGDADVDVLASAGQDNSVTWFENDGSGGFTGNEITASDTFVTYVFAADVDGDGDVDVLSAAYSGETVKWFENDAPGKPREIVPRAKLLRLDPRPTHSSHRNRRVLAPFRASGGDSCGRTRAVHRGTDVPVVVGRGAAGAERETPTRDSFSNIRVLP